MADESFIQDVLRREDFLSLRLELINLRLTDAQELVRILPDAPAYVVAHFAPQAIAEEAYFINAANAGAVDLPPVRKLLANPSRLVFRVPDDALSIPYTLEALLNWTQWQPSLAPNALPRGTIEGPAPAPLRSTDSAIEFPHRVFISPDGTSEWLHRIQPLIHNQYSELWHTRLGIRYARPDNTVGDEDTYRDVRAVWRYDARDAFVSSLTQTERTEIWRLSSDFSIRPYPAPAGPFADLNQFVAYMRWFGQQLTKYKIPSSYVPRPISAERLMLTSLGATARLESRWDYPTFPPANEIYPVVVDRFGLEQYQHIAGVGRDQYVKTVTKAYAHTGHRMSLVKVTERMFQPLQVRVEPQGAIFGAVAYLRQYIQVIVQQPEVEYTSLHPAFDHQGRELPFKSIRLTTLITPRLDLPTNIDLPFWLRVLNQDFLFDAVGIDVDGNEVHFQLPLMLIPFKSFDGRSKEIYDTFRSGDSSRRTIAIGNQTLAYAPSGDRPGSTHLKTSTITFDLELPGGTPNVVKHVRPAGFPTNYPVRFLPYVRETLASVPAIEHLLGTDAAVQLALDDRFLAHGFNQEQNPAESFLKLITPMDLKFPADKAGGLARPDMGVRGLSRTLGAVSNPTALADRKVDISAFADARLLGGIKVSDILGLTPFDPPGAGDVVISDAQIEDPKFRIKAPLLQTRKLYDNAGALTAIEVRYLWKPVLQSKGWGPFAIELPQGPGLADTAHADLLLDARLVRQINATSDAGSFTVRGRLRHFRLMFAGAVGVSIRELYFHSQVGAKMDVGAKEVRLTFDGPLKFVDTLRSILPDNGFDDPPYVTVDTQGILAGYTLAVPTIGVGIFSLQNLSLSAALSVPFIDKPAGVRFAISERHHPFIVTVTLFGGGGFFALAVSARGIEEVEAAIEFGGNIALNLGIASGGVYVMAGIYFKMTGTSVTLTGYLRMGGFLDVLGIISISIEFYLGFTYRSKSGGGGEVWGQASVKVSIKIAFFSMSVSLSVERRFAGAAGDPTFADTVTPADWEDYLLAFA